MCGLLMFNRLAGTTELIPALVQNHSPCPTEPLVCFKTGELLLSTVESSSQLEVVFIIPRVVCLSLFPLASISHAQKYSLAPLYCIVTLPPAPITAVFFGFHFLVAPGPCSRQRPPPTYWHFLVAVCDLWVLGMGAGEGVG